MQDAETMTGDLLDGEQVAILMQVLSAEDWRITLDSFNEAGRATVEAMIVQAQAGEDHHRTAHTLKGMALNLGTAALGQLTHKLERAPTAAVLAEADRLRDLFERSVAAMRTAACKV